MDQTTAILMLYNPKLIDSHAHLTASPLYEGIEEILEKAKLNGVEHIINICTDLESLKKGLALSRSYQSIFNTAATPPQEVLERVREGPLFFDHIKEVAKEGKLIAIGETGLDYHRHCFSSESQKKSLISYFELLDQINLPLIIHCRNAFEDLFDLADLDYKDKPALIHCFTGGIEEAKNCLDRGWYLSFSGIATYPSSSQLRETIAYTPLDRLLIETDAPYLAPQSKRGKVNEPSYIVETAETIAQTKKLTLSEISQITRRNTIKFFSLQEKIVNV